MNKTCPYPGLRPFGESESLFFKGRDSHVKHVIKLLEKNKFLMLTGASGDGKSSLVYAGVIPGTKAGFFHAEFNNWLFVDFKPERDPLGNLSESLSANLNLPLEVVNYEMQFGFSALVKLYKKSEYHFQNPSQEERKQAANLFILADQFEEFFTSTENYSNGKPSNNAYTTVNILLETAQIAFNENLPIYIICTMRSDFISQCVAFRGLPEAIGFSNFFVPRLKRNEVRQIIEEPAQLAGGSITNRLVEFMINDLRDGFDQLPVLQYVLSKLWQVAGNGNEEIDFKHLALLDGVSTKYLNIDSYEDDGSIDNSKSSLFKVLDRQADLLYEKAFSYHKKNSKWTHVEINELEVKEVIEIAFKSLTKIDNGRTVRSRKTIYEITSIINKPHITFDVVCGILNIFRLPDNTFISPYINKDDITTQFLPGDSILDISHEALIRNWGLLQKWEEEENRNIIDFQSFKVQLELWSQNAESIEYLLGEGLFTFYKEWYTRSKFNASWVLKYDDSLLPKETKTENARNLVSKANAYLTKSDSYLSRMQKAKIKRRNIAIFASLIVILLLSGFSYRAYIQKQEAEKQKNIAFNQQQKAELEKQNAITAKQETEKQRIIAQENAEAAQKAQLQSENARKRAENLRIVAENQTQIAKAERTRAIIEQQNAQQQEKIAINQRKIAEFARDSAENLTFLSLAQNLAYKAMNNYENPQLNLLLALQSDRYHTIHQGINEDPVIFEALQFALFHTGYSSVVKPPLNNAVSFKLALDKSILILDENGDLYIYSKLSSDSLVMKKIELPSPINFAHFLNDRKLLISLENRLLFLFDIHQREISDFGIQEGLSRASALVNESQFVVSGRNQSIDLWDMNNKQKLKSIPTNDKIRKLQVIHNDVFALTYNGKLLKWNIKTNDIEQIADYKEHAFTFDISDNIIIVGLSNGAVVVSENGQLQNISLSSSILEQVKIMKQTNQLIVASTDGKLVIYDLSNISGKPKILKEGGSRVKQIEVFNNTIYTLHDDNTIHFYALQTKFYRERCKKLLNRRFSDEEWSKYVGKNVLRNESDY
jgi:hypothetical protein